MAAVTDYDTLTAAINDLTEGGYATGETDRFIGLAEADFRLYFGPHFAKESASLTLTFTAGSTAIPAGFIRPLAMTHATYGSIPQTDIGTIRARRIAGGGNPTGFAVTGSTVEVDGGFAGTMIFDFEGSLVGLSSGNTTNWLITNAPQVYLAMCVYYAKAFDEDPSAPVYLASAMQRLNDLSIQSIVAQQGRATVTIPGMTP